MKRDDRGFTLIELVIAITLSLMIGGVVVMALVTSLNASSSVAAQVGDSTDAGLITAYLTRDAQSAGGIVPTTSLKDTTVGVSILNTTAGWAGCQQAAPATLILRFSWIERTSTLAHSTVVVTYGLDGTTQTLTRRLCIDSTTGADVVLGRNIATAVASCNVACTGTPTFVSLAVTGKGTRSPLAYTLKVSLRGDKQAVLAAANTTPLPLLALGAGASVTCPNVEIAATGPVTVVGNVLVDSLCDGDPIKDDSALLRPTGTASTVEGIVDPYATRAKPSSTCATTGTNPATIGLSALPTTVVKYPQPVNVTADTLFQPGRFMFCRGLTFTSGQITGTNVLLYIATGSFEVKAEATVNMTGQTTTDKQMLVWSAEASKPIKIALGPRVSSYRGVIYAPTSRMELSSVVGGNLGSINAQGLTVTGAGQARIGLSIPVIAVSPATTLPGGQANVPYSNSSLAATGGTAPYTWSATDLPAGLTMSPTGAITGTPTTSGNTTSIIVTVFDATKAAASFDYSMAITKALGIADAPTLPDGQVDVAYATTTLAPTDGTAPFNWSVTSGLPPGLNMTPDGTMSGTPAAAGPFSVVVQLTDAMGGSATRSYVLTIAAPVASCPGTIAGWRGEYYDNVTLTAPVKLCRDDANVDFDWGYGSPDATLPSDNFSVRWTKTQNLIAGTYTFTMGSDDGSRLYIDGVLVLDRWFDQGYPTPQPTVAVALAAGDHTIMVEYYERGGAARASLTWVVAASGPAPPCPADPRAPNNYWQGQYYGNATLAGSPSLTRNDEAIDFNWGTGSPAKKLPSDNFSVRWTRTSDFAAGQYTFALGTDDGGRLYIDGVLTIDRWVDQGYPVSPPTTSQTLAQGSHTIVVEYFEHGGDARATLETTLPANGVAAVPSACGDLTYFGEQRISLSNSLPIDSMTATINVRETAGVAPNSQYVTFEGGNVTAGNTTSGGLISYTFTLDPGRTIVPGQWTMAAQWNGTGTPHPTSGDTWALTTHTTAGTQTVGGTF